MCGACSDNSHENLCLDLFYSAHQRPCSPCSKSKTHCLSLPSDRGSKTDTSSRERRGRGRRSPQSYDLLPRGFKRIRAPLYFPKASGSVIVGSRIRLTLLREIPGFGERRPIPGLNSNREIGHRRSTIARLFQIWRDLFRAVMQ